MLLTSKTGTNQYHGSAYDLFRNRVFNARNYFAPNNLQKYVQNVYALLSDNQHYLPNDIKLFLPYMIEKNWLYNYQSIEGIARTLTGLSKRVSFENKMDESVHDLRERYSEFESDFTDFFPELSRFVKEKLKA